MSLSKAHLLPKVLVIDRKRWLRPNMTEKLFTGTLRINQPTNRCLYKVLLLIKPMHHNWNNRGESLLYRGQNLVCVTGTYKLPVYVPSESKVSCSRSQRCGGCFKPGSLDLVSDALPLSHLASQKFNSVCIYIDPIELTRVCTCI